MTTIGSTAYYTSSIRYSGSEKADASKAGTASQTQGGQASSSGGDILADSRPSSAGVKLQGQLLALKDSDWEKAKINVSELPEEQYQTFVEQDRQRFEANSQYLKNQYTQYSEPDTSNDPRMNSYATITAGGKVVATIDNQGGVTTETGALGDRIQKFLADGLDGEADIPSGPSTAQDRADKIADLLGGQVLKASSAVTQAQYDALPPIEQPTATVDSAAMKNDPLYDQLQTMYANLKKTEQERAAYLARQQAVL